MVAIATPHITTTSEAKAIKEAEVELCIKRERFMSEVDRYQRKP